jgi:hypothetical protein
MAKSYHKRRTSELSAQELEYCSQVYCNLCSARKIDSGVYNEFCSVLRFPYQTLYNNFEIINFVSEMKFETFEYFYRKIIMIHRRCQKCENSGVCGHIESIGNGLKELISASTSA